MMQCSFLMLQFRREKESVLVIGGGPVGIEFVGEIVTDFPDKKVSLLQTQSKWSTCSS